MRVARVPVTAFQESVAVRPVATPTTAGAAAGVTVTATEPGLVGSAPTRSTGTTQNLRVPDHVAGTLNDVVLICASSTELP